MTKKVHLFLTFLALSIACPIPPFKGGIPLIMWVVSTVHWIVHTHSLSSKLIMVVITVLLVAAVMLCSRVVTWLSWKANNRVVCYVTLIGVYGAMICLAMLPIYDGGGWLDPVPSKTLLQMIKTGI